MAILEENDILFAHKALNVMAGLTEATRRVAGAIIDHFNKRTGQCDPSIERLATLLGIDRATVIRATDKLHELGFIEKTSHGGKAHRGRIEIIGESGPVPTVETPLSPFEKWKSENADKD